MCCVECGGASLSMSLVLYRTMSPGERAMGPAGPFGALHCSWSLMEFPSSGAYLKRMVRSQDHVSTVCICIVISFRHSTYIRAHTYPYKHMYAHHTPCEPSKDLN